MCTCHDSPIAPDEVAKLVSRRGFMRTATTTAAVVGASAALAGPALAQETRSSDSHGGRRSIPPDRISVQLYTLRDQLSIDLPGTLAALHQAGYTRVEHAGFVGRTAAQFKAALDANHLWASSGHTAIPQPFNATTWAASLADARTLGSRYIVHPFFGIDFGTGTVTRTTAAWRAFAHDLNRAGRMARDAGVRLGYHNHNWDFFRLTDDPSRSGHDVLAAETDPDLVHLEIDLFWAWRGGRDPVELIAQHRGRVRQFHVKDMNRAGRMARDAGLKLGYHNHNWDFFPLTDNPSRSGHDVLAAETDPDLVHLEVDLYWAWRGAADPVDLVHRHRGRIVQVHVKDLNQAGSFEDPGQGLIDFGRIFAHGREAGVVEFIVERDDAGTAPRQPADSISTARVGFDYLKAIRF